MTTTSVRPEQVRNLQGQIGEAAAEWVNAGDVPFADEQMTRLTGAMEAAAEAWFNEHNPGGTLYVGLGEVYVTVYDWQAGETSAPEEWDFSGMWDAIGEAQEAEYEAICATQA